MDRTTDQLPSALAGFGNRLAEIFGIQRANRVLDSMRRPKVFGYWVNPLRSGSPLPESSPLPEIDGYWTAPDGLRQDILRGDAAINGQIYPINPSSLLAVAVLAPQAGEEVLDLAAAPGGKTIVAAAAMANQGRIAVVEPVKGRFHRMRANLARCGVEIAEGYLRDGRGVGSKVPDRFDAVLLDAPCSSEARIRLDEPQTYAHWKPRKIREVARKQRALLASAYRAVKPGGRVVYCTCSFAPEENELVVQQLLSAQPDAIVADLHLSGPSMVSGIETWRGKDLRRDVAAAVRVVPDGLWDGFFLCRIEKPV
ncbi:MAG: RsmB/NOP family class I SAM-dependent RNA methyltransferase [Pseudomonadales bacterium]|nr:RsmB/NOP family class I SAM-dependent RNA methyltransferase [Pseudomonadales bacterium]NIX09852.1 RsmB/NOP family class I SAM-dependent RNA methyltransferase [Pseudomonadales bacterium]